MTSGYNPRNCDFLESTRTRAQSWHLNHLLWNTAECSFFIHSQWPQSPVTANPMSQVATNFSCHTKFILLLPKSTRTVTTHETLLNQPQNLEENIMKISYHFLASLLVTHILIIHTESCHMITLLRGPSSPPARICPWSHSGQWWMPVSGRSRPRGEGPECLGLAVLQ